MLALIRGANARMAAGYSISRVAEAIPGLASVVLIEKPTGELSIAVNNADESLPEQPYASIALERVAQPTLPGSAETIWKHWAERKKNGTIRSEC